jgi:hypothetical protein
LNPQTGSANSGVPTRGSRIHQHHQANLRKSAQSSKNQTTSGGNSRVAGSYSGANNLMMQNYPLDGPGSQNPNYNYSRTHTHQEAAEHQASLAGKFKKKNGRLVQDHINVPGSTKMHGSSGQPISQSAMGHINNM